MEFKFRAVDDRPPPSSFDRSDQLLPTPGNVPGFPRGGNLGPNLGQVRNPSGVQGLVMREVEKERISEEMIMEEIARRRELEAVVRREIMFLEREMAMRRAATGAMPFEDGFPSAMRFAPFEFSPHPAVFNPVPLAPPPPADNSRVVNPLSEPNKDKLIVLAKPDPRFSQAKRKALGPPVDANEVHPFGLKKKPKEEFSCAICQVGATCDKDLNNHLQGKKHKRREAALKKQKMVYCPRKAPFPKKAGNPLKPKDTNNTANSNPGEGNFLKQLGSQNGSDKKKEDAEDIKPKNKLPMQKDQNVEELIKTSGSGMVHKVDSSAEKKKVMKMVKNFRFWCEMCHVGSVSPKVMEQHKKGKKHQARLLGCEPKNKAKANLQTTQASVAVPVKTDDPDVANQANGKTAHDMKKTEVVHVKPEATDVANQANGKTTDNLATTEAAHENPKDTCVANQANRKTADDMATTEAVHKKPEETSFANEANGKMTYDMATTEAVHEKPEDTGIENEINGKLTDNMEILEAIHEKPEDTSVANEANGKTTYDMATTGAVHEKPEDTGIANKTNRKLTDDMEIIEAVHEMPEDTSVANEANGKTTYDMETTEAVHEKPEDTGIANETIRKLTDDMEITEAVHEKSEDTSVANEANGKTTYDMATTEAVHEKLEDTGFVNETNGKLTADMEITEAVHEKLEDTSVANEANGKTTYNMATTEAVHERPEDTGIANETNGKLTVDMEITEAVDEKPENKDVVDQANEKAPQKCQVPISRVQLQRPPMLSSLDGQN